MTFEAVMLGAGATLGIDRDDSTLLDLDQFVLEDYSGLPDACEIARALDPNDDGSTTPDDGASDDLGNDGFTNKQEFQFDTDPHVTGDFPANFPAADPWALASLCALLLIAARRRVAAG